MEAKIEQLLLLVQKQQQHLVLQEEKYNQLKKEIDSIKGNISSEIIDATNSSESAPILGSTGNMMNDSMYQQLRKYMGKC